MRAKGLRRVISGKRWLKKEKSGVKWGIKQAILGKGESEKCF
jgi:hypothetical protein